jgi:hypothetical protein
MAGDEIAGATVTINTGRIEGDIGGKESGGSNQVLQKILETLKAGNAEFMKKVKKEESGLLSSVAGGGALSGLLKGGPLGLGALGVALGPLIKQFDKNLTGTGYLEQQGGDGSRNFVQIENRTGEIVDILTEQEAENAFILDEQGEIKKQYQLSGKALQMANKNLKMYDGVVLNTLEELESVENISKDVSDVYRKILSTKKAILKANEKILENLNKQLGNQDQVTPVNAGPGGTPAWGTISQSERDRATTEMRERVSEKGSDSAILFYDNLFTWGQ